MPKTNRGGDAKKGELPATLERSDEKAQRTFAKAHDSAAQSYGGDEARAHRVAYSAVKHTHEKVGDHWEPMDGKGPSDAQAEGGTQGGVDTSRPTAEGVDANASKNHLLDVARNLDIAGRSAMAKGELVEAIKKENRRRTARARSSGRSS